MSGYCFFLHILSCILCEAGQRLFSDDRHLEAEEFLLLSLLLYHFTSVHCKDWCGG